MTMHQRKSPRYIVFTLIFLALLAGNTGRAAEVAGVQVEDRIKNGSTASRVGKAAKVREKL